MALWPDKFNSLRIGQANKYAMPAQKPMARSRIDPRGEKRILQKHPGSYG